MAAEKIISFGDLLRRYRRAAGLTQEALAERAGLSTRAISALEQRVNQAPRADTIALLAAGLALEPEERTAFEAAARRARAVLPDAPPGGQGGGVTAGEPPLIGRARESALEEALALHTLARCAQARGDLGEAETHLRRALVMQGEFGFALDAARTRLTLAEVLVAGAGARAVPAVPQEALALVAEARGQCTASGAARDLAHAEQLAAAWACC